MKHTVAITDKGFVPAKLTVRAGDVVHWRNDDTVNHWPSFHDLPMLCPSRDLTFECEMKCEFTGVLPYFCQKNPEMKGEITVVREG